MKKIFGSTTLIFALLLTTKAQTKEEEFRWINTSIMRSVQQLAVVQKPVLNNSPNYYYVTITYGSGDCASHTRTVIFSYVIQPCSGYGIPPYTADEIAREFRDYVYANRLAGCSGYSENVKISKPYDNYKEAGDDRYLESAQYDKDGWAVKAAPNFKLHFCK